MKKTGLIICFLFLTIFSANAVKMVYGEYKIYVIYKKFKKDPERFMRLNVHYDGFRIVRVVIGEKSGKCELFSDKGKLIWEHSYKENRRVFKRYYPDKKQECYTSSENDYDTILCFYPNGQKKYEELRSGATVNVRFFNENGIETPAPDSIFTANNTDPYSHNGIKLEDSERKIVFRSPTRLIYVRTSMGNDLLDLQIFDKIGKDRTGLVFQKEYHLNGKVKRSYSINGNSEMLLIYNEKGQNIERRWKMIK